MSRDRHIVASIPAEPTPFAPSDVAGLIGWYDAASSSTLTLNGNEVVGISNRVEGGAGLFAVAEGGPSYEVESAVANGLPALVWPDQDNFKGLWLGGNANLYDLFVVLAYRNGATNTFSQYTTITTDAAGLTGTTTNRVMGHVGRNHLYGPSIPLAMEFRVNGSDINQTILPLPLSVLHIKRPASFPVAAFGSKNNKSPRAWRGPVCEVLAFAAPVPADEVAEIEMYLMQKWGIV